MGDNTNFTNTGGVLPSNLSVDKGEGSNPARDAKTYTKSNFALKVGQIEQAYCSDEDGNVRGSRVEYDVLVTERSSSGSSSQMMYRNVTAKDLFGGIADFFQFTYRKNSVDKGRDVPFRNGSLVLILCTYGSSEEAVIVGGIKHPDNANQCKLEDGHNLKFEFNGINFNINKDGAMTLLFRGPTDANGKVLEGSEEFGGTVIKIEKDGSYEVNSGHKENPTKWRLDKKAKTTTLISEKGQSFITMDKYTVTADKDISLTAGANLILKATGSATFEAESLDAKFEASVNIKCKEMKIESKTMVEFKTKQFKTNDLTILGDGGTALVLSTLVTLGQGNLGIPVISVLISGSATKVLGQ